MKSSDSLHQAFRISLLPGGRLTSESLKKQTGGYRYRGEWPDPCLKFMSFEEGVLTLRNTSNEESHLLRLQVKQNKLLVSCNCGHGNKTICKHAYWTLGDIHWKFGEYYFTKLMSHGMMEMAFKYPVLFDKQESNCGLNVFPRTELKSVYHLAPAVPMPDIKAILNLPDPALTSFDPRTSGSSSTAQISGEKVMAYLIVISVRYEHLPSVIPVIGLLTVKGNAIKSFDSFLDGLQKTNAIALSEGQKELHEKCLGLYKLTEKLPGELLAGNLYSKRPDILTKIFSNWTDIYSMLLSQLFVFKYVLFGKRELRGKPKRDRWLQVTLSESIPVLSFVVTDKDDHYRFSLRVHVDGVLLDNVKTGMPLFIIQNGETIFRLGSLRDACLVEWLDRSGGWITVFKEYFDAFQKEVLVSLQQYYTIQFVGMGFNS
ncbi:hypothetical protein QEG73_19675 [Chitinophagaceae bacterium 26-R-25]|nr:hypothetical protein [Chitinophagaceae bacterium 26-R-25]